MAWQEGIEVTYVGGKGHVKSRKQMENKKEKEENTSTCGQHYKENCLHFAWHGILQVHAVRIIDRSHLCMCFRKLGPAHAADQAGRESLFILKVRSPVSHDVYDSERGSDMGTVTQPADLRLL